MHAAGRLGKNFTGVLLEDVESAVQPVGITREVGDEGESAGV